MRTTNLIVLNRGVKPPKHICTISSPSMLTLIDPEDVAELLDLQGVAANCHIPLLDTIQLLS